MGIYLALCGGGGDCCEWRDFLDLLMILLI